MEIRTVDNIFLRVHKTSKGSADIWFIHGFGESGLSFREAFSSPLADTFNLFVPDFPGFGVSPFQPARSSLRDSAGLLEGFIRELSGKRPIVLVAHSLGGIVGTWIAPRQERLVAYLNIEGNLTAADTFFSGLAARANSAEEFYRSFTGTIYERMEKDLPLQRYYASLRLADPRALIAWGKSGVEATGESRSGEEFAALQCRKVYLWGDKSTPEATRKFIERGSLPNQCFSGCGHWPMLDQPEQFYRTVLDWIVS